MNGERIEKNRGGYLERYAQAVAVGAAQQRFFERCEIIRGHLRAFGPPFTETTVEQIEVVAPATTGALRLYLAEKFPL